MRCSRSRNRTWRAARAALPGRALVVATLAISLAGPGCAGVEGLPSLDALLGSGGGALDESTVVAGLKEALEVGTRLSVDRTSAKNGFLGNAGIRIPLPDSLEPMAGALRTVGLGSQVDQVEVAMNRAAEQASSEAFGVFAGALRQMSFDDARRVLGGGKNAATKYFRSATEDQLRTRFEPIVGEKMEEVGLVRLYEGLADRYAALPLTRRPPVDLRGYVTQKGLDGLFTILAEEERRIRTDPAARTTELLVRVFGS